MDEKLVKISIIILGLNKEVLDLANADDPEFVRGIEPIIEDEVDFFYEDVNDDKVQYYSFPVRKTFNKIITDDHMDKFNEVKLKLKDYMADECPNEEFTDEELTELTAMVNVSTHQIIAGINQIWNDDKDLKAIICVVPVLDTPIDKIAKHKRVESIENNMYDLPLVTNMGKYIFKSLQESIVKKDDVRIGGKFGCRSVVMSIIEHNKIQLDNTSQYLV